MIWFAAALAVLCAVSNTSANEFYKAGVDAHTDKVTGHAYHHMYHLYLRWWKHKPVRLLEIGLGCTMNTGSASINLWQSYFTDLDLYMADIDTACAAKVQNTTKNKILIGDQNSEADLKRWIAESGGNFDVVVDDGSHSPVHQVRRTARGLWKQLASRPSWVHPGLSRCGELSRTHSWSRSACCLSTASSRAAYTSWRTSRARTGPYAPRTSHSS